ncbi:MAG: hypothetical protein F6K22_30460 [Okeania sp. SIO2F4]|nr:hypothetical protein [Okeania sp. SIO2F4]
MLVGENISVVLKRKGATYRQRSIVIMDEMPDRPYMIFFSFLLEKDRVLGTKPETRWCQVQLNLSI